MNTILLISGAIRSFRENIHRLPQEYDIAIYVSRDEDDTYINPSNLEFLLNEPRVKTLLVERAPTTHSINAIKQWYKLYRLWQCVPKEYDRYVRIRPDVCLLDPDALRKAVGMSATLVIPDGSNRDGINDQFAIGNFTAMDHYVQVYKEVSKHSGQTSEWILANHLKNTPVLRAHIPYKLVLSQAKVIAIAGDSGSGKSTLCTLIRPLFLFDKVLEYETDRYHKWERGDTHWKTTSHLNPEANYLEKLEDDTFNLKIGNAVFAVDYDHSTGKFTPPKQIEPKENILLCGLHTLHTNQLRNLSDLKIYLDTSRHLKAEWKLLRDQTERNQSREEILAKIESRRHDYATHIEPQRDHADIVITRDKDSLRIDAPGHPEWVPEPGTWGAEVDMRPEIAAFLQSVGLPQIDARTGYDGVIQLTVLRALYTKHG